MHKKFSGLLIILWVFGSLNSYAQSINFQDGFEDGNFTANPAWQGDTTDYAVINGSPNHLLQLQGDAKNGGVSYLSTPSTEINGSWEFYINLQFSPSGSNYADVFVMSNIANLDSTMNGYAVQAGERGSGDVFRLVRFDHGQKDATVLSGTTNISSGGKFRVKVTRQPGGQWTLQVGKGYAGPLKQEGEPATDSTYQSTRFFGVRSTYTSSRADKFYYDFKIDLPPFAITGASARGDMVDVTFNRPYDSTAVSPGDFSIDQGLGSPASVSFPSPTVVQLHYPAPLDSKKYTVKVQNLKDENGKIISNNDSASFIVFGKYSDGDVNISEFMYDPPTGQSEYVELKNLSGKYLNLHDWKLSDNADTVTISYGESILRPDSFLVISSDTSALFRVYGSRPYLQPPKVPALNNDGDVIKILTGKNNLVDSLKYTPDWGGSHVALERRSDVAPTVYKENFGNSPDPLGGTPGLPNEVAEDDTPPALQNLIIKNKQTLTLIFSERLKTSSAENADNYYLNNGISVNTATQITADSVQLKLSKALQNGRTYQITVENEQDIFGNKAASIDSSFIYYHISPPDSGDVFINEFMYDPPDSSSEYVELKNPTSKSFDLQGWTISDNTGRRRIITDKTFILPPDSFVVLAPDESLRAYKSNIALISMGSDFPSLNNGGDQIILRDSSGIRLDSLSYTSDWGGKKVALERRTTTVPPFKANFGDAPNGFGTPGSTNQIPPDKTPPHLTNFSVLNSKKLQFIFNEGLQIQSATNKNNYQITGGVNIHLATLAGDDTVRVQLAHSLKNNSRYEVKITGIKDRFGNAMTRRDTSFTFYKISPADSGDVFINEFSYDPPDGSTEYVELYNHSSKSLNLKNWTINDNTGDRHIISDSKVIIPPDSFAVLAPDQTLLKKFPDINLVTLGSRFPSLNNGGDNIVIRRPDGVLLDSLTYTKAFGGNGMALERRTISAPPVEANFGDAPNGFGTPGSPNQITPDTQPPVFQSLKILNSTTFQLLFSKNITGKATLNSANYTIYPARHIRLISAVNDTVTLFLSKKLQSGQTYNVTVQGVHDIFGNTVKKTAKSQKFVKISPVKPRDVVINEILYDDRKTVFPEFIELYNRTKRNYDLSGWEIGNAKKAASIPHGTILQANNYLVLTGNRSLADKLNSAIYVPGFPTLRNDSDAVYIRNSKGTTVDSLFYSSEFGGHADGKSAERKDPRDASNDPSNFASSTAAKGATPGTKNAVYQPDKSPPSVTFAHLLPDGNIEARFSEFITLNDSTLFTLNGRQLSVKSFKPSQANTIRLQAASAVTSNQKLRLSARHLEDVRGNIRLSTQVPVARKLLPGQVVINEIMYDPISNSNDNKPDQSEYVELYNTKNYAISLEGISLHDAPDENGDVRTLNPVSTRQKYIPARSTALIYADEASTFQKSRLARFFHLKNEPSNIIFRVNRKTLSLASSGDAVYLADKNGTTIDSVYYDKSWQNPNLADTKGISLERINPEGPGNQSSNWGSSTAKLGGTPGRQNSLYQIPKKKAHSKIGISFSPNPFSPDGDGKDDRLFINYKLDHPNYLITVQIYDRYGRKIRRLANDQPAPIEGSLVWDGLKDDGSRNRIGIYIVVFKAYDSTTGAKKVFKKTVVLARRLH
ncbi:MAG TPA: lamin tail domain-containing protein [Balneolaceae bacterium]|nr:lamin tail domain-containing protein [Balneolaceae bacterium]